MHTSALATQDNVMGDGSSIKYNIYNIVLCIMQIDETMKVIDEHC